MNRTVPLRFLDFSFHDSYYIPGEFYQSADIERCFDEGLAKFQPLQFKPALGSCLTIDEYIGKKAPSCQGDLMLLQVLQIMPKKVKSHQQSSELVLHELAIEVWSCRPDSFLGRYSKGRFQLSRLGETDLHVVLDKPLSYLNLQLNKKGHLCLLLDQEFYSEIMDCSDRLRKEMNYSLDRGTTILTGLTSQQAVQNCHEYHKVSSIRTCVLSNIDVSYISLGDEVLNPGLSGANLVLTRDLDCLFLPDSARWDDEE